MTEVAEVTEVAKKTEVKEVGSPSSFSRKSRVIEPFIRLSGRRDWQPFPVNLVTSSIMAIRPTYNDQLPFLIEDWQGNPLDEKGLYQNQGSFTMRGWSDVWKWQTGPKPFKEQKKNDNWRPDVLSMRDPASWPANGI